MFLSILGKSVETTPTDVYACPLRCIFGWYCWTTRKRRPRCKFFKCRLLDGSAYIGQFNQRRGRHYYFRSREVNAVSNRLSSLQWFISLSNLRDNGGARPLCREKLRPRNVEREEKFTKGGGGKKTTWRKCKRMNLQVFKTRSEKILSRESGLIKKERSSYWIEMNGEGAWNWIEFYLLSPLRVFWNDEIMVEQCYIFHPEMNVTYMRRRCWRKL